jgi:uncharacterized protein YdiU (UPF0061 family)
MQLQTTWAQTLPGTFAPVALAAPKSPTLVAFNEPLAVSLGLDVPAVRAQAAAWFSGASLPPGAQPIAQAYAGHQFGGLSPQLGDGRAALLGEAVDPSGKRWDLALKGSGRTVFSRGGDGKAALGPMLREWVIGEALTALGIPASRALAVVTTGEDVLRERRLPGAVLARVASSHLRVGTLEYYALRGDLVQLHRLVGYTLERHHPEAKGASPALALLTSVRDAQASLVASWMAVGFIHGVLNTDNVTLSGESLDFGPCAFLERHDAAAVFSSIDAQGRYAYGNQPSITQWNLARLAGALLPVIDDDDEAAVAAARAVVGGWSEVFEARMRAAWARKLALTPADTALIEGFLKLLEAHRPDHTLAFRGLSGAILGDRRVWDASGLSGEDVDAWLAAWRARVTADAEVAAIAQSLEAVNPVVIARNHVVEGALSAAERGDFAPVVRLVEALQRPFHDDPARRDLEAPAPDAFTAGYQTFCGT